jgi:hypothetical protein
MGHYTRRKSWGWARRETLTKGAIHLKFVSVLLRNTNEHF